MAWIFLTKNVMCAFNTIVYRYAKPSKWIQILTKVVSVIYCSAGRSNGILCFLAELANFCSKVVTASRR